MHGLFGTKHLILAAVSCLLIGVLYYLTRKIKFEKICKYLLYVGIVSEIIKIFYYTIQNEAEYKGTLPRSDLPFHLCSIQILLITIVCVVNNEKIKRFVLSFMMPSCLFGGIAAILIATHSARNGMWIITLQYFGYHIAISVFALHILLSKEFKLNIKDYFNALKFLLVMMFFAFYINSMLYDGVSDINFMYVVSPPQAGLPFLNENHGWLVYILHYAALILFCVSIAYIKPIISAIKEKAERKKLLSEVMQKENAES